MKKIYFTLCVLFNSTVFAGPVWFESSLLDESQIESDFDRFLTQWKEKTELNNKIRLNSARFRKLKENGKEDLQFSVRFSGLQGSEKKIFQDDLPAKELYELMANFDQRPKSSWGDSGYGGFNAEEVKQHVLNVCKTMSKDDSEMDMCTAQVVKNREALCGATPLIGRDTCVDLLQEIFPNRPGFLRKMLNFLKKVNIR